LANSSTARWGSSDAQRARVRSLITDPYAGQPEPPGPPRHPDKNKQGQDRFGSRGLRPEQAREVTCRLEAELDELLRYGTPQLPL